MDYEKIIQEALENSASAKELGEETVRVIVSYIVGDGGTEVVYDPAWFEGWKYYDDVDEFIEEYYDLEDEMDIAREEMPEIADDEEELRFVVFEHLTEAVFSEFDVIDLSEYLDSGEGYLLVRQLTNNV